MNTGKYQRANFPRTLAFLNGYEKLLGSCAVLAQFFDPDNDPFYAIYNVGDYTFAPYKVLWSQVSNSLDATVVSSLLVPGTSESKIVVPDHSLCSISFQDATEAHYVAACLNNSVARWIVKNYIAMHPSPNIMGYLPVCRYSDSNHLHRSLAELSKKCHAAIAKNDSNTVVELEAEIDIVIAKMWEINGDGLKDLQENLRT